MEATAHVPWGDSVTRAHAAAFAVIDDSYMFLIWVAKKDSN